MSQTAQQLRVVLANTFHLYFKIHSSHWNVQGPLFHSMHQFFGVLYEQVFDEIDTIAEQIRALGEMAPGTIQELLSPTTSSAVNFGVPFEVSDMIRDLVLLNDDVLKALYAAHDSAAEEQHDGVVNFIETSIDAHAKIAWQLKALLA